MSSLYELSGARLALQHKLDILNLDTETINDTLDGESAELEAKIQDYGFVIRNLESFSDSIKSEEKRLSERRKAHDVKVTRIKEWLLQNMIACGISRIECPAFTIAVQNNPASVAIDAEGLIPEGYMRLPEPLPLAPNKSMIATALKSGQDVPGCHLEQSQRLVIK